MLDLECALQDHRVDERVVGLFDHRLALFLEALDRRTGGVVDLPVEQPERLFDVAGLGRSPGARAGIPGGYGRISAEMRPAAWRQGTSAVGPKKGTASLLRSI
jgi:hypothetical protein